MLSYLQKLDVLKRIGLTFFYLGLILGCSDPNSKSDSDAEITSDNGGMTPIQGGQVSYTFSWTKDHVEWTDDDQWRTQSDLDYQIEVTAGYIVTYTSSLVPCAEADVIEGGFTDRLGDWIVAGVLGSKAWAGHGDVADQSAIGLSFVERIGGDDTIRTVQLADNSIYCDVHYLIARGDPMTQTHVGDAPMDNRSLFIDGRYQRPGSRDAVPFTIDIAIAYGLLESTQRGGLLNETRVEDGSHLEVQLTRPMAKIFDGIQFEKVSALSLGRRVLRNLVDKTVLSRTAGTTPRTNPEAGR